MLGHMDSARHRTTGSQDGETNEQRVMRQQQVVWYVLAAVGVVEIWLAGSLMHLWR